MRRARAWIARSGPPPAPSSPGARTARLLTWRSASLWWAGPCCMQLLKPCSCSDGCLAWSQGLNQVKWCIWSAPTSSSLAVRSTLKPWRGLFVIARGSAQWGMHFEQQAHVFKWLAVCSILHHAIIVAHIIQSTCTASNIVAACRVPEISMASARYAHERQMSWSVICALLRMLLLCCYFLTCRLTLATAPTQVISSCRQQPCQPHSQTRKQAREPPWSLHLHSSAQPSGRCSSLSAAPPITPEPQGPVCPQHWLLRHC